VKKSGDVLKKTGARGGEDDVVHVNKKVGELVTPAKDEQGGVRERLDEPEPMRVVGEALVPRPGSLLQAVERLVKPADMVGASRVDEARWLLTVNLLVKSAMEKGILDIKLMNQPSTRSRNAEDDADSGGLNDRTKSLVEVNPGLLREAPYDPACLVASKPAVRGELMLEDPFT
jgi:hypothetical protein